MRIGVFGGSFNPIHKMHLDIAKKIIDNNELDKVIILPASEDYERKELLSNEHRLNMINIAVSSLKQKSKYNGKIEVSDYEIKNGKKYTYEVMQHFTQEHPNDELVLLIGADNLNDIKTWREYKYLLTHYKILVVNRDEIDINITISELENLIGEKVYDINVSIIDFNKISSTQIRQMIKNNDSNVTKYIDDNVYEYIKKNNLYM